MDEAQQARIDKLKASLSERDFTIMIDTSGSMDEAVKAGGTRTRWDDVQESAISFARDLDAIDDDGLSVVMFGGSRVEAHENVHADDVKQVFATHQPHGGTPLAEALTKAFDLAKKSAGKKNFIVVFTDGIPNEPEKVAEVIRKQANSQNAMDDCKVLFVQVGDDAQATRYLEMLDSNLKGAKFDIVAAKTLAEAEKFPTTAELVIHSLND